RAASSGLIPEADPLAAVRWMNRRYSKGVIDRFRALKDRTMTGHDRRCTQRQDHLLEHLDRSADRAHEHERRAAVEDQVAAEEQRAVGYPHDRIVRGVRRAADMADFRAQVSGVERDLVSEGNERRIEAEVTPLRAVPERQVARRSERDGFG